MLNDNGLSVIVVKKEDLQGKMQANLANHRDEYKAALAGYRKKAIDELTKAAAEARDGGKIRTTFSLPEPQDHSADYERVLRMLEMSIATDISITEHQFSQYVLDDWAWSTNFKHVSSAYAR